MVDAYFQVSNSLWTNKTIAVQQSFAHDLEQYVGASATSLDCTSPQSLTTINSWVSCSTHGAIPTILSQIDPAALLYLINAVYFHGQWVNHFQPRDTHPQVFTTVGKRGISVPMMHESGVFDYYQTRDFQLISLTYEGARYSMDVILPRPGLTIRSFAPRLRRANWGYWTAQVSHGYRSGSIALPRFQFGYSTSLNQTLQARGMTGAFSSAAEFERCDVSRCPW